jgi:multimeric flavodoxin WrbA
MGCQKIDEYRCVIDDELSPLLARLPEADVVVFATPVYWFGPTAQIKLFIDRMFSLINTSVLPWTTAFENATTTLAVISTSGGSMEHGLGLLENTFKHAASALQLPFESFLVPTAPHDPEEIEDNVELKENAAAFGRKLAGESAPGD